MAIKHGFISEKADSSDPSLVNPTNWNAAHIIETPVGLEGQSGVLVGTDNAGSLDLSAVQSSAANLYLRRNSTHTAYEFGEVPVGFVSIDYDWSQNPSGSLVPGSNVITLTPVPPGVNGTNQNHWVFIDNAATVINVSKGTNTLAGVPMKITTATNHNLITGNIVKITGMSNPQANGCFRITVTAPNSFTLNDTHSKIFVRNASNTTPITIITSQSVTADHGYQTGDTVIISGVLGNTAANGTWTITRVDDHTVTLNGSAGNGAWQFAEAFISGDFTSPAGRINYGPEAALIVGGSAVSGADSGTIIVTCANSHPAGYSISSATAGTTEAITAALVEDKHAVSIRSATWQQGVYLPSNFDLSGSLSDTTITAAPWYPEMRLINILGTLPGVSTTSTTSLLPANRSLSTTLTINVASTAGLAAGDYILLAGYGYYQTCIIQSISGLSVTMQTPVLIPLNPSESPNITKYLPATNVSVRNMVLVAEQQHGQTQNIEGARCIGIYTYYNANCIIENIISRGWSRTASILTWVGYGNYVRNISSFGGGSYSHNDQSYWFQTNMKVLDLSVYNAISFAMGFYWGINIQVCNISIDRSVSRGLKINASGYSTFTNIFVCNSIIDNNIAISAGTYQCYFSNVISNLSTVNEGGMWFAGSDEQYNVVNGLTSVSTVHGVLMYPTVNHNTVMNVISSANLMDFGEHNTIITAIRHRASIKSAVPQSIPSGVATTVNLSTVVYDVGGLFSAGNPNKLVIPIGAGGDNTFTIGGNLPKGCLFNITAQVEFAAHATGQRVVFIYKNLGLLGVESLGVSLIATVTSAGATTFVTVSCLAHLMTGDVVSMQVLQDSGGPLNIAPYSASNLVIAKAY